MKVLIPSDNRDFVAEMAVAYQEAGCEVVTGAFNFDLGAAHFDLVHFQWPEEFSDWKPPSEHRLSQIAEKIRWWKSRCPTIVTVHNLYPHGYTGNQACKKLYEAFYATCSGILHFSTTSKNLVCEEFASAQHDRHIVTAPWNFDRALKKQKKRGSCRDEFGIQNEQFVVLVLGALRSWREIQLLTTAFSSCGIAQKKLLMAGRYNEEGSRLLQRWRQARWRFWLWRHRAVVEEGYIPDEDLFRFLDTSDIVVIPRIECLNSGIPSLAMTFGKMVIAPSHGSLPEFFSGTENLLYESGNPSSLANALEKAVRLDRTRIGAENRELVNNWSWDKIVNACLNAAGKNQLEYRRF